MNSTNRSRILVADHDQTFLDQLADRLLQMELEVDFAENGKTAIELVESESYDLIVTEIAMPIFNGLEILRKAKEYNPSTPILITSFSATTDWAEQAVREGAYRYLLRPLNKMRDFDQAVNEGLQHQRTLQQNPFFSNTFSQETIDESPGFPDIPMPNWELEHTPAGVMDDPELSRPKPMNTFTSIYDQETSTLEDRQGKTQEVGISLPEGAIELNFQGQILSCNPAARNWLKLDSNTPDQPIRSYIKALSTQSTPANIQVQIGGRPVYILTNITQDGKDSERIVLLIREAKEQASAFPATPAKVNGGSQRQARAKAVSGVSFSGKLKNYTPDSQERGWSPLMFIDQMKKTIKDEVEKIKENNPLQIFEQQPEEVDPEVIMTMSRRISDISQGRRSSY